MRRHGEEKPMTNDQCPMPNAQCPKRKNAPEYFLGLNQGASTITLY
ncbi:hypothetical protein [Nostoc sp.]